MQFKTKSGLREKILQQLRDQKEDRRLTKSLTIAAKLFQLAEFQKAQTILFYASFDGEVDTTTMIKQAHQEGKTVALPQIETDTTRIIPRAIKDLDKDCEVGVYGVRQPVPERTKELTTGDIDMVIVPAVAFDGQKHRLGRGKGYYDRFLERCPDDIPKVGLAFDFQVVDEIPGKHDKDAPVTHLLVG